jgi:hypothetical protein
LLDGTRYLIYLGLQFGSRFVYLEAKKGLCVDRAATLLIDDGGGGQGIQPSLLRLLRFEIPRSCSGSVTAPGVSKESSRSYQKHGFTLYLPPLLGHELSGEQFAM